jgi:hypothetical protein
MKSRPKEVSDWIKSKKKDSVPSLKSNYGDRFMEWWKTMLPSWQSTNSQVSLLLSHDVPSSETWQVLKKGGRSGFNVVVMGLSWWVIAQHGEGEGKVWSIVNDLMWVLQEMKKDIPSPVNPQK